MGMEIFCNKGRALMVVHAFLLPWKLVRHDQLSHSLLREKVFGEARLENAECFVKLLINGLRLNTLVGMSPVKLVLIDIIDRRSLFWVRLVLLRGVQTRLAQEFHRDIQVLHDSFFFSICLEVFVHLKRR
jgi:hypothetical protein